MDKPADAEEIQLIAVLRVLGCSQDEVASALHIHKSKLGEVERWIKTGSLRLVEATFEQEALKRVVGRELPALEQVKHDVLVRASQVTADDILRHYRDDYLPKGQETDPLLVRQHHRGMLDMVRRWKEELSIALWMHPLRDLGKPGLHREFVKAGLELMWEVEESGDIRLCYPLEVSDDLETTIVRGFLYQHLKTSKYSWLLEREMPRWKILGGQELAKRCQLLEKVDQIVRNRSGLSLKGADRQDAGPTWDFSNTIWAAAVDGVHGNLPYGVENAQGGLHSVRYGGFSIALAYDEEEVRKCRGWHRELMLIFGEAEEALYRDEQEGTIYQPANDPETALRKAAKSLFNDIVELKGKRGSVMKALQRGLMEIIAVGHVPGQCDCRPGLLDCF